MAKITKKTTTPKATTPKITPKVVVKKETKPALIVPEVKTNTQVKFRNNNLLISPRKLRLVANDVKTYVPSEAMTRLKFTNSKSARILVKSIQSAINDATHNHSLLESTLRFKSIRVDEGQKIKRMDKSHGSRFSRGVIIKRHSRLEIMLEGQKQ